IGFPTLAAVPRTTAWIPWLRCPPPPDPPRPRKTLAGRCLRGKVPSPRTPRFQCPPWLWFVVLRADHSLQFSSRPPSSRAFLVGYRKVYSVRCEADVVMTSAIRWGSRILGNLASRHQPFCYLMPGQWSRSVVLSISHRLLELSGRA